MTEIKQTDDLAATIPDALGLSLAPAYVPAAVPDLRGATDHLTFWLACVKYDITLTVSQASGLGRVIAISGTADGACITGLNTYFGRPDNKVVSLCSPQFDWKGLSFDTTAHEFNLYDNKGSLYITDHSHSIAGYVTNETFTVTPLCFLRGTRLLTPEGEVAVEDLAAGDRVTTLSGEAATIRWIGEGKLLCPPGRRSAATPVIVRRHALGENVPHRDLRITKGHALYVDGVLIPAEFLVNHRSILWDDAPREVAFFHIELPAHDVLLAEGAPAESYRDEGNRWMFANANPAWDRPGVKPYAPVLTGGPIVDAAWRRLLERSGERLNVVTTGDADVHLLADGARVNGRAMLDGWISFAVPEGAKRMAIASRSAAQDELGLCRDPRKLGVALTRIVLWRGGVPRVIDADDSLLVDGFHVYEEEEGSIWTDGLGIIPTAYLEAGGTPDVVELQVRMTTRYALAEPVETWSMAADAA
jgi:hypothetical protein